MFYGCQIINDDGANVKGVAAKTLLFSSFGAPQNYGSNCDPPVFAITSSTFSTREPWSGID